MVQCISLRCLLAQIRTEGGGRGVGLEGASWHLGLGVNRDCRLGPELPFPPGKMKTVAGLRGGDHAVLSLLVFIPLLARRGSRKLLLDVSPVFHKVALKARFLLMPSPV